MKKTVVLFIGVMACAAASNLVAQQTPVGTLSIASSTSQGIARDGFPCGISADGSLVAFDNDADRFDRKVVRSDRDSAIDVFLKDTLSDDVTLVSTTSSNRNISRDVYCLTMTPDAKTMVFAQRSQSVGRGVLGDELFVKNLDNGDLIRVTPEFDSIENLDTFQFISISDDGRQIAYAAKPVSNRRGSTAPPEILGPTRLMVTNLDTGIVSDFSDIAKPIITSNGSLPRESAIMSRDGKKLAFVSTNGSRDVRDRADILSLDIDTREITLLTDFATSENRVDGFRHVFRLIDMVGDGTELAYLIDLASDLGDRGIYVRDLDSDSDNQLVTPLETVYPLAITNDKSHIAYTVRPEPERYLQLFIRDIANDNDMRADQTLSGVLGNRWSRLPIFSRDGKSVAFENFSSNLVPDSADDSPFGFTGSPVLVKRFR